MAPNNPRRLTRRIALAVTALVGIALTAVAYQASAATDKQVDLVVREVRNDVVSTNGQSITRSYQLDVFNLGPSISEGYRLEISTSLLADIIVLGEHFQYTVPWGMCAQVDRCDGTSTSRLLPGGSSTRIVVDVTARIGTEISIELFPPDGATDRNQADNDYTDVMEGPRTRTGSGGK